MCGRIATKSAFKRRLLLDCPGDIYLFAASESCSPYAETDQQTDTSASLGRLLISHHHHYHHWRKHTYAYTSVPSSRRLSRSLPTPTMFLSTPLLSSPHSERSKVSRTKHPRFFLSTYMRVVYKSALWARRRRLPPPPLVRVRRGVRKALRIIFSNSDAPRRQQWDSARSCALLAAGPPMAQGKPAGLQRQPAHFPPDSRSERMATSLVIRSRAPLSSKRPSPGTVESQTTTPELPVSTHAPVD